VHESNCKNRVVLSELRRAQCCQDVILLLRDIGS
jgi:hypothetical protein